MVLASVLLLPRSLAVLLARLQLSVGSALLCRLLQLPHTMLWTDERLQQVIARYTPVLHLHEEERYLPCSVDWYIKRSQLWLEEPVEHVSKFLGHLVIFLVLAACVASLHVANGFAQILRSS